MTVAVFSTKPHDREYLDLFNHNQHTLTYFDSALNADTTNLTVGFNAVCVFVNDVIDAPTIEKLVRNGIKIIALRCAGFNNVDLLAAKNHDIKVVRVPAYSPEAVAEHAVALILTLNRKTHKAYNRVRESNFSLENLVGFDLHGKTVGVVGTGKIGAAFCKIMLGFGCKVLAFDVVKSDLLTQQGVDYQSLSDVLAQADILSLHCPLTPDTAHLINEKTLSTMKRGVMLINTSRGGLIDTTAVIDALKTAQLGYLGIDVYEQEAQLFFKDLSESLIEDDVIQRLLTFHNVLITPHQGFFTKEALTQIATTTLKNLTDFERGNALENEVG
jgi:D-lactate dehydrogenase